MSLAITIKGPEGIVLAADSRVTLTSIKEHINEQTNDRTNEVMQATYDNASKLLRVPGQDYVGAVVCGVAALGDKAPRTIHSYLPELEESLKDEDRLKVKEFAQRLSSFFNEQWQQTMPDDFDDNITFLVGGYDEGEPYGRVYEVKVPSRLQPIEKQPRSDSFGISIGGQHEYVNRLVGGIDSRLPGLVQGALSLDDKTAKELINHLRSNIDTPIPYQFLALQDCVDFSMFLIRTTMEMMRFTVGIRGVGGPIDVAVVTRTEGFRAVQQKQIAVATE